MADADLPKVATEKIILKRAVWNKVIWTVAGVLILSYLTFLMMGTGTGGDTQTARQVAPATTSGCAGEIRHAKVGTSPLDVNPGGRCSFTFEITAGQLYFNGPEGPSETWWPGKRAVDTQRKRIVSAQALAPGAELDYMLCPPDSPTKGWSCR